MPLRLLLAVFYLVAYVTSLAAQVDYSAYIDLHGATDYSNSLPYTACEFQDGFLTNMIVFEWDQSRKSSNVLVHADSEGVIASTVLSLPGYIELDVFWLEENESGAIMMVGMIDSESGIEYMALVQVNDDLSLEITDLRKSALDGAYTTRILKHEYRESHYYALHQSVTTATGNVTYTLPTRMEIEVHRGVFVTYDTLAIRVNLITSYTYLPSRERYLMVARDIDNGVSRDWMYLVDSAGTVDPQGQIVMEEVVNDTTYLYGANYLGLHDGGDTIVGIMRSRSSGSRALTKVTLPSDSLRYGYDFRACFQDDIRGRQGFTAISTSDDMEHVVVSSDFVDPTNNRLSPNRVYVHRFAEDFTIVEEAYLDIGDEILVRDVVYNNDRIAVVGEMVSSEHVGNVHGYILILDDLTTSSVNIIEEKQEVSLYPNPLYAMGALWLEMSPSASTLYNWEDYTYRIIDVSGRSVQIGSLTSDRSHIEVAGLASGLYFISIKDPNGTIIGASKFQILR